MRSERGDLFFLYNHLCGKLLVIRSGPSQVSLLTIESSQMKGR
jgi:hypothetical protein